MNNPDSAQSGFRSNAHRDGLDKQQQEQRKIFFIQQIIATVDQSAFDISRIQKVIPEPLLQQNNDTCLFACLVSVKKALAKQNNKTYLGDETSVAQKARQAGILLNGGTFGNHATADFVKSEMDLEIVPFGGDPLEKSNRILQALREKDFPLLAYSLGGNIDHWVVVTDIVRRNSETTVIAMNPLKGKSHEGISVDEYAKRIVGDSLSGIENPTVSSIMVVRNPDK